MTGPAAPQNIRTASILPLLTHVQSQVVPAPMPLPQLHPSLGLLLLAVLWDRFVGEPPNRLHPVAWLGNLIGLGSKAIGGGPRQQFLGGLFLACAVPALAYGVGAWVETLYSV